MKTGEQKSRDIDKDFRMEDVNQLSINKAMFKEKFKQNVKTLFRKTPSSASDQELYQGLAYTIRDLIMDPWMATHQAYEKKRVKQVYYLSMEFLPGPLLGNYLLSLHLYDVVEESLEEMGVSLERMEQMEPDPGLGNGGLGRLAACFLDSLSTLEYPAYGCGIRYRYGIFEQEIKNGYQIERPDQWLKYGNPWEVKRPEYTVEVKFKGEVKTTIDQEGKHHFTLVNYQSVFAVPFDIPILGFRNNIVNTLRLWDAQAVQSFDLKKFEQGEYQKAVEEQNLAETIVKVLYPADLHEQGKELRLKQQYFFISATVQQVIQKFKQQGEEVRNLPYQVAFQLNDTHPAVAIPELMRILMDQEGLSWEEAWDITTRTCAYTNHTVMTEALEMWPVGLFSRLLPRVYQIIEEINRRFCLSLQEKGYTDQQIYRMAIIADGHIRMAYLCIVGSHAVNGVARLHTEILKQQLLKDFYQLTPEKFHNKTNGITQRRWLLHANPKLADWVTRRIGDGWMTDLKQIEALRSYAKDTEAQAQFMGIKHENKCRLARYIKEHNDIYVDPYSIFDIQIKRLHEYKRQLLNALHILYLYNQLKTNPHFDFYPRTFIFGAKAASGYVRAKLIIKLINNIAQVINSDPVTKEQLQVVFIKNYRVSNAEVLIPAADVSEQISTAGKEASGTGNMKFMLNGALTIGTLDGANVEILEEVGEENIFIFGLTAEETYELAKGEYNPREIYESDPIIREIMNQLINGFLSPDDPDLFREIHDSLLNTSLGKADEYFILKDFQSYKETHEKIQQVYSNPSKWAEKAILNTASSGKFSADRTIEQYAQEIWKLKKTPIIMSN
mgnify:FL=1